MTFGTTLVYCGILEGICAVPMALSARRPVTSPFRSLFCNTVELYFVHGRAVALMYSVVPVRYLALITLRFSTLPCVIVRDDAC